MIATELAAQVATAMQHGATLAAAEPKGINTEGVVTFFASNIAPILLAVLGVIFIGRASRGECGDHGYDSGDFGVYVHPLGARPGGLPADVDDIGSRGEQRKPVLDGGVGVGEESAVGKGVRGHIEDPHHRRVIERQEAVAAPHGTNVLTLDLRTCVPSRRLPPQVRRSLIFSLVFTLGNESGSL